MSRASHRSPEPLATALSPLLFAALPRGAEHPVRTASPSALVAAITHPGLITGVRLHRPPESR